MAFWAKWIAGNRAPRAASTDDAGVGASAAATPPAPPPAPAPPGPSPVVPPGVLSTMNTRLLSKSDAPAPSTDKLNGSIVQAVQLSNAETASYAPTQIALGPDMMISQAAGLVAQSAANYFDGVSKLVLASQGVLLKQMTQALAEQKLAQAAEDALGIVATDLLMGAAAAVAAAAGAMEAESASFAIDRIDQSIAKYSSVLASRQPPSPSPSPSPPEAPPAT